MRFSRILIINLSLFVALAAIGVTLALASGANAPASPGAICSVPDSYSTLQNALDDFTCSVIQVITGTYPANLVITRSVTIQGVAANLVVLQGSGAGPVISTATGTNVTLQGMTLSGGASGAQNGGGVVNQGNLVIQNVQIVDNSTQASGGGIANLGTLTLVDSSLSDNQAGDSAGAIFLGKDSNLTMANVTISANRAVNRGGAIADSGLISTTLATIYNTTIVQNSSLNGAGGVDLFKGSISLVNTILAQNYDHNGLSNYVGDPNALISKGHNLEDGSDAGFTASGDLENVNPLLSPLALNGGSTLSHALLLGSLAIDGGNATICSRAPVNGLDQRGVTRDQGAACDIGAYEYNGAPLQKQGPARAPAGEVTTYTLLISSLNPYITALKIEDVLPAGLAFNDHILASFGNASYDSAQKKVSWNNGAFSPAASGSAAALPSGLYGYALAQCSDQPNQFYTLGGLNSAGIPTNTLLRYDAAQDVWTALAAIPAALANSSATCDNGRIYLLGGYDGSRVLDQMYIYDIATDRWITILHGLPNPRMGAALGTWQGKLYLAGGITSRTSTSSTITDNLNIYDIASATWTSGEPLPKPTAFTGYTQSGSFLFTAGGWSSLNPTVTITSTARLDLAIGSWTPGPPLPSQRADFALLASETSLYALGGVDRAGVLTNTVIDLDLSTWTSGTWTSSLPDLPHNTRAIQAACTPIEGGRVWLPGGFSSSAISDNIYRPLFEGCASQTDINVIITFQARLNAAQGQAILNTATLSAGEATFEASARTFIPPEVSIGDVSHPEGKSGTTTLFEFPLTLSAADEQSNFITLSTRDGTATLADHDYRPRYQVLTIPAGTKLVTFTVTVNGDDRIEGNEIFFVEIVRSGDLLIQKSPGVGTILNDDFGSFLPVFNR
jgi:Kelch motif/Calx-beta domain